MKSLLIIAVLFLVSCSAELPVQGESQEFVDSTAVSIIEDSIYTGSLGTGLYHCLEYSKPTDYVHINLEVMEDDKRLLVVNEYDEAVYFEIISKEVKGEFTEFKLTHKSFNPLDPYFYKERAFKAYAQYENNEIVVLAFPEYMLSSSIIHFNGKSKFFELHNKMPVVKKAVPQAASKVYIVKEGDFLLRIAEAHGVSVADLIKWNALDIRKSIVPGQKLLINYGTNR